MSGVTVGREDTHFLVARASFCSKFILGNAQRNAKTLILRLLNTKSAVLICVTIETHDQPLIFRFHLVSEQDLRFRSPSDVDTVYNSRRSVAVIRSIHFAKRSESAILGCHDQQL
jgi:hypothetical protein